ncbi:MAG: hypothetical protein LBK40_05465, partial [Spirochaetaceae bacterium]|nr:hypothetical protein [Spirochaetaceae bacterium]
MRAGETVSGKDISFVLRCVPRYARGVGSPRAVPVLAYNEKFYPAREVSLSLSGGLAALGGESVGIEDLEALGIGVLGRYIDGKIIGGIALKSSDILGAAPERTRGFWQGLCLDQSVLPPNAPLSDIFTFHFEFLRRWGLPGGMVIDWDTAAPLLLSYLRYLSLCAEKSKILVLMPREHYGSGVFPPSIPLNRLDGGLSLFTARFRGTGICFYDEVPANLKTLKAGADILFLVEPPPLPSLRDALGALRAALVLGIGEGLPRRELFPLFGIRGALKGCTHVLFREAGLPWALP